MDRTGLVAETTFLGRNIEVFKTSNGRYTIFTDGVIGQRDVTAEEVIGWMANAMMNAKS